MYLPAEFPLDIEAVKKNPDKFLQLFQQLYAEVVELRKENQKLRKENHKLRSEIAKYTSPHIPSSKQLYPKGKDEKGQKKKKSKKSKSGLDDTKSKKKTKRGGSKPNKTGMLWDRNPDIVIPKFVDKCLNCFCPAPVEFQTFVFSKRILEIPKPIPPPRLEEHHLYEYHCQCGGITRAGDPTLPGTSLGPNYLSLNTVTRYRTGASFENMGSIVEDFTDQDESAPSTTALHRGYEAVTDLLPPLVQSIGRKVARSDYVNADETSHKLVEEGSNKNGSKKIWVWVMATVSAVFYIVHKSRGHKALKGFMDEYLPNKEDRPPPAVVDCWSAYPKIFDIIQWCWAHLLRDSKDLEDCCHTGVLIHDHLVDMYKRLQDIKLALLQKDPTGKTAASEKIYLRALEDINDISKIRSELDKDHLDNCDKVRRLQKRLSKSGENYLTVLRFPKIPMTNNPAEQKLKTVILHRGNGKSLRSTKAMTRYGDLLTVLTTWRMNEIPIGISLRRLIDLHINQSVLIN